MSKNFRHEDLARMKKLIEEIRGESNLKQDQACELLLRYLKDIEKEMQGK